MLQVISTYRHNKSRRGWPWPKDFPILYVGNHNEWRSKVDDILDKTHLSFLSQTAIPPEGVSRQDFYPITYVVARHIRGYVSPNLLQRTPGRDRLITCRLLEVLSRLARPFDFLNLPTELRLSVYDYLDEFQPGNEVVVAAPEATAQSGRRLPVVLKAVGLIEPHANRMFFRNTTFHFHAMRKTDLVGNLRRLIPSVRHWLLTTIRNDIETVRRLVFHLPEEIEVSFVKNRVSARSLSNSLRSMKPFPIPESIELVQQARDRRLEELQYLVQWTNAEVEKSAGWKIRAIKDILTTDEEV